MPTLNDNKHIIKYADDTVIIELQEHNQPSTLQSEAEWVAMCVVDNYLLPNAKNTTI